jgi:hypothetical protein
MRAYTGHNQPSTAKFIFGSSRWVRGLIKPWPGRALAYVDYSSQEIGIAAALSGDVALTKAYTTGDPYLACAVHVGLAPSDATRESHKGVRTGHQLRHGRDKPGAGPNLMWMMLTNRIATVYGWQIHVGVDANPRGLQTFRCKRPARRCCGWRAALPRKRGYLSLHRYTMRYCSMPPTPPRCRPGQAARVYGSSVTPGAGWVRDPH